MDFEGSFKSKYLTQPRRHAMEWVVGIFCGTILASSLAYGIPVVVRAEHIGNTHRTIRQLEARNILAEEIAGTQPLTDDRLGKFASRIKTLLAQSDPVSTLTRATNTASQRDGLENQIGLVVFSTSNSGDNPTSSDPVYFSNSFILLALEIHLGPLNNVLRQPPTPIFTGLLRWQWLAEGEGALLTLMLLSILIVAYDRRNWLRRAEERFLKGKSDYFLECWRATVEAEQRHTESNTNEHWLLLREYKETLEEALKQETMPIKKTVLPPTPQELREILEERKRILGDTDE